MRCVGLLIGCERTKIGNKAALGSIQLPYSIVSKKYICPGFFTGALLVGACTSLHDDFALAPESPLTGPVDVPDLIRCQGLGHNHTDHVVRGGFRFEIDDDIGVFQSRGAKGRAAGDARHLGAAEGKEPIPVAEQEVEHPLTGITTGQFHQSADNHLGGGVAVTVASKVIQNIAEQRLTVGAANRLVVTRRRSEARNLAIMGTDPVPPPEFADKRVRVGQTDLPHIGLPDVANGHLTLDRAGLDHLGDAGIGTGIDIVKRPNALPFVKGHTPAVLVGTGGPATTGQAGETETQVGGGIGAHGQQFAHGSTSSLAGNG